jgi:23S rRNA pseudouridine1911/1915/1917 synthase
LRREQTKNNKAASLSAAEKPAAEKQTENQPAEDPSEQETARKILRSNSSEALPEVIRETSDWMAIAKPSGWHSVSTPESSSNCVETWLRQSFDWAAPLPESGLLHRLDEKTSGIVLVAKNLDSYESLRQRFRMQTDGGIEKTYLAIAEGELKSPLGGFKLYFQSRYKRSKKISVLESGKASEEGRCRFRCLDSIRSLHLLEVDLIGSGKRHQIRAGLAHLGTPLLGDELYGGQGWAGAFGLHSWKMRLSGDEIIAATPPSWSDLGFKILSEQASRVA